MSSLRFILASLWHHRRVHVAVAAGVAVATAVITGALLVGDSVRGSLRDLAVERLGRIDTLLVAEQPFRSALADELAHSKVGREDFDGVAPLLFTPGTLATTGSADARRRATQLSIFGCDESFWQFGNGEPPPLTDKQCGVTQSIAAELQVEIGDEVLLRLTLPGSVPADSSLGEKTDASTSVRLKVAAILPGTGLARFSLRPSQLAPRNVFVPLATLQKTLELTGRINLLAIGGKDAESPVATAEFEALRQSLAPTLDDYNIRVDQPTEGLGYVRITADRLVLPPALVAEVRRDFPSADVQPVVTYLANTISLGEHKIPYSTIAGVDSLASIGPLLDDKGQPIELADDQIALNDWAAQELNAKIGDTVTITYYEPETTHGMLKESAPLKLRLKAVVPLEGDQPQSTAARDRYLTPDLPGVTDQRSINDWDLPFELVEPIRQQDEDYWDEYATTPKAFVSYSLAHRLWKTRWGIDSVLRIAARDATVGEVIERVHPDPADMGMILLPVKQQGLRAARGTTSFEGLFLGFSFFLMASAVMLIALLVRLGVESRAAEVGVLAAVGCSVQKLRRLLIGEGAIVVLVGAALGVAGGIGYARLMIHGLTTWWVAATVTPFLELHILPRSLVLGAVIGLTVALLTVWSALRKLIRLPARQLMSGDCSEPANLALNSSVTRHWLPAAMILVAAALAGFALRLQGEAQAGAFFGSGALVLTGLLIGLRQKLRQMPTALPRSLSLAGLAARNARRNPSRTLLSVGLAAVASFLIVALSAFRLAPSEQGTGGFDLMATTDQPVHFDLNTPAGRTELGFRDRANEQLAGAEIYGFRVQAGEDASCLNLYQTSQPQIVGVPRSFYGQSKFGWAATSGQLQAGGDPWQLLDLQLESKNDGRPIVPVVLDKNTAVYSLHLSGIGAEFPIQDAAGQSVTLRVVGLLAGSVLQGNVLMSEANLLHLFPETAGQQLYLIRTNSSLSPERSSASIHSQSEISTILESQLEDYGFDAVSTSARLAEFLAVQNTYLSTFQSLGALGLLLGTVGLAVTQLRSVLERRGELALMRSAGFRRSRLAEMVLGENFVLLLGGLGIGCLAALVAVLPHWLLHSAETPWATLGVLLLAIILAGLAAGWLAVRAAVRAPLLPALRGD